MMKRNHAATAMALALCMGLAAPVAAQETAAAPTDLSAATVVATVNGTEITLGHMIVLRDSLPAQYQSLGDDVLFRAFWTS
jgi:peptidyl-prolyl cis-trans isomerase C